MSSTASSYEPSLATIIRIMERKTESNLEPHHIMQFRGYIGSARSSYYGKVGGDSSELSQDEKAYYRCMQKKHGRNATDATPTDGVGDLKGDGPRQSPNNGGRTSSSGDGSDTAKKRNASSAFTAESVASDVSDASLSKRQKIIIGRPTSHNEGDSNDDQSHQGGADPAVDDLHRMKTPEPNDPNAAKEFRRKLQDLRNKQHKLTIKELTTLLESLEGSVFNSNELAKCKELINILEEKYKKRYLDFTWSTPKAQDHPTLIAEFVERLAGAEEAKRAWMGTKEERVEKIPGLLMRAWDQMSQCRINDNRVGFLSGGSANYLNTYEERREWLGRHADWGNRRATPFISFSKDLFDMNDTWIKTFEKRQKRKNILENTKITIINTHVRMAARKPIARMMTELLHYNVKDKHGLLQGNSSMFEHEYIIPFSVTPEEIVATYSYPKVLKWIQDHRTTFEGWYKEVAMPAWEEHERVRTGGKPAKACQKDCACCGH